MIGDSQDRKLVKSEQSQGAAALDPIVGDRGRDTSCLVPTGWPRAVARSPAPTERSVQISRTTLVRRCFTARRQLATPSKGDTALVALMETVP